VKWLHPEKAIEELPIDFDDQDIVELADRYKTHPAVVVGRLQWIGILGHSQRNNLKRKVSLFNN
jgi:hypothetical protein